MLNAVRPSDSPIQRSNSRSLFRMTVLAVLGCMASPLLFVGCRSASAGTTTQLASPQEIESARQQMNLIPPPSKSRYMAVHSLTSWENPYLTVQQNIATLHVTVADANPASLGIGGMLRPAAARQQDVIIRTGDLPEALSAVPADSWPYGRVVAIEEAHDTPQSARPAVRRNIEATLKTLGDMGVVAYEWNEANSSR
jgi:hypothetical protein